MYYARIFEEKYKLHAAQQIAGDLFDLMMRYYSEMGYNQVSVIKLYIYMTWRFYLEKLSFSLLNIIKKSCKNEKKTRKKSCSMYLNWIIVVVCYELIMHAEQNWSNGPPNISLHHTYIK